MKKFRWSNLYLIVVFILLYVPIFYLIFYSFNEGGTMNAFTGFTFEHYQSVFQDTRLMIIVLNTFMLASSAHLERWASTIPANVERERHC